MNKILLEIRKITMDCVDTYLSDISSKDLEDNGAIFYMNGKKVIPITRRVLIWVYIKNTLEIYLDI